MKHYLVVDPSPPVECTVQLRLVGADAYPELSRELASFLLQNCREEGPVEERESTFSVIGYGHATSTPDRVVDELASALGRLTEQAAAGLRALSERSLEIRIQRNVPATSTLGPFSASVEGIPAEQVRRSTGWMLNLSSASVNRLAEIGLDVSIIVFEKHTMA